MRRGRATDFEKPTEMVGATGIERDVYRQNDGQLHRRRDGERPERKLGGRPILFLRHQGLHDLADATLLRAGTI